MVNLIYVDTTEVDVIPDPQLSSLSEERGEKQKGADRNL